MENTMKESSGLETHLAGKKDGFTSCGQHSDEDTLVQSVKDATCYYCKLAWEKGLAEMKIEEGNSYEQVWTTNPGSNKGSYMMPDIEIKEDKPEYVYMLMRGHSASLLVLDIDDEPIGWIDTRTLGYESAKEWAKATKYIVPESKGKNMKKVIKEDIFNVISAKDIKELHDNAWELKTEFADVLDKFAKRAKEVSKTLVGLKDKVAAQRLEKDAYDARNAVLKTFFPSTLMKTESNQMNSSKEVVDEGYETDEDAKTELALYMDNEYSIYNQKKSIIANLMRKMKSGKYDPTLAPKLWAYWVESGAKAYAKEFDSASNWSKMFPKPLRDSLAAELAKDEEEKIKNGEYGSDPSKL